MNTGQRKVLHELLANDAQRLVPPHGRLRRWKFAEPTEHAGRHVCDGTIEMLVNNGWLIEDETREPRTYVASKAAELRFHKPKRHT